MGKLYIVLAFCMLSNLYIYSQEGKKEFIEQILSTYQSDKTLNSQNAKEKIFKDALNESNITLDTGNYMLIPQFDLVFKKISKKEKKKLSQSYLLLEDSAYISIYNSFKNKYFTYVNANKLYLTGMYVFKDSVYYGNIIESPLTKKLHFRSANNYKINKVLWVEQYAKIIWQQRPDMLFTVRTPWSPLFFVTNNDIKVFHYDSVKDNTLIWDIDAYLDSPYFSFGDMETERYKPILCY